MLKSLRIALVLVLFTCVAQIVFAAPLTPWPQPQLPGVAATAPLTPWPQPQLPGVAVTAPLTPWPQPQLPGVA